MFIASDFIRTESEKYGHLFSLGKETKIFNTILHFQISQVFIMKNG
jgi:hypothetical protein